MTLNALSYLYTGGGATLTGPTSGTLTDQFGLIYTAGTTKTLTFSGNVQVKATSVVANGDFTISGANDRLHRLARRSLRSGLQQQL